MHSGYLGDSIVGSNCRFGAGFVSANKRLDRKTIMAEVKGKKIDTKLEAFGVVAGPGAKFGIQSGTMPGVFVGASSVVGPNTQVSENAPDDTMLFTKQPQKKQRLQ